MSDLKELMLMGLLNISELALSQFSAGTAYGLLFIRS
jgi:hypothetical protein